MLYLSRGEQVALFLLLALLLAGGGVLTYERGVRAGKARREEPLLVETARPPSSSAEPTAGAARAQTAAGSGDLAPSSVPDSATLRAVASRRSRSAPKEAGRRGKLSLNRATAQELDSLPGIGPVYARRIIEYRERKKRETGGGFESVDELLNVPGIGPKRFAALRDHVAP